MENSEVLVVQVSSSDEKWKQPIDDSMVVENYDYDSKVAENNANDSVHYEKFLLDEMDSYLEDINDRLTVTRMVHDSVIKGIVNAVKEEAEEKIVALEAKVAYLNNTKSEASVCEQNWEREFQDEVNAIVVRSFVSILRDEFEKKLRDQRSHWLDSHYKRWVTKFDELSSLRQELDVLSKSLSGHEPGASHVSVEWANTKMKDRSHLKVLGNHLSTLPILRQENGNGIMESGKSDESKNSTTEIAESAQLMRMTKEDLISYFKTEITNMKRSHESDLQEITEDYYKFRRDFLKEWGSSPLKKDKEFDALRKKILEIILKLDDILIENEKLPMDCVEYENLCGLRDKVDNLSFENQRLQDLLMDKRKEVNFLNSQVSDAADQMSRHSLAEANLIKEINKLKCDDKDVNIGIFVREEIYKSVFKELIGRIKCDVEDSDVETIMVQEMSGIIFREAVKDADATINMIKMKYNAEKEQRIHLESVLLENQKTLCLEIKEKERLEEEKMSLLALIGEKEKLALEAKSTLIKQEEQFKLNCQEFNMARVEQARLIDENKRELDLIRNRLEEALENAGLYEVEISKLDRIVKVAVDELRESERQRSILRGIIQDKEHTISSAIAIERERRNQIRSIIIYIQKLSKSMVDFECKVVEDIKRNNSRLEMLKYQSNPLIQQTHLLGKRLILYKQRLERSCSDLQMAEAEVDLLGDEVDGLLSLLEKIYIALDHYSPILQHYSGVMEILQLVRRELKGETTKPV